MERKHKENTKGKRKREEKFFFCLLFLFLLLFFSAVCPSFYHAVLPNLYTQEKWQMGKYINNNNNNNRE